MVKLSSHIEITKKRALKGNVVAFLCENVFNTDIKIQWQLVIAKMIYQC